MATGERVSRREAEVLALVGEHLTNAEIATRLYISERTVESHVSALLRKLGAADRRDLARHHVASGADRGPPRLPPALELLADATSFVGRTAERTALRDRWRLAQAGRTMVVFVTAEAGMGKSRLVSEVAVEVNAGGGRVLYGACHEDVDEPYGPFAQAIGDDAALLEPADVARRLAESADGLAWLSPELARLAGGSGPPSPPTEPAVVERSTVLDAIRRWLHATARSAPLLLVIEDLHWSTATTRDALRHLVRGAGREPLLVVATARDKRPDLDADLAALLADLERSPSVSRLPLPGLDRDEVVELVGAAAADADVILAETGGNPLLATHMTADARQGTLPIWLYRRDTMLDDEARAVLDMAAVFGTEFDADQLAAAHGRPLLSVLESLEAAEAVGLVVPRPGPRAAEFGFVHALFRSHRYRALPLRRRIELHARAATALAGEPADAWRLAARARHACLSVPVTDVAEAIDLARRAGRHDEQAHAYDEAVGHYRRALDAARFLDPPDPAVTLDLTVRVGAALHHRGDPAGLPMLLDSARRAEAAGDTDVLVRAAQAIPQFGAVGFVDPMPAGKAITEAALAALAAEGDDPSAAQAQLLVDLASHWLFVDVDEAVALGRRAEAIARRLGDPHVLGGVLLAARHLFSYPGGIEDRLRIGGELERLGDQLHRLAMTLAGIHAKAMVSFERGELDAWIDRFERFRARLAGHSLGFFRLQAVNYEANRAFLRGDLEGAEELARSTVPLSQGIGAGRTWAEATIVANRRLQGRDEELVARFERAAARSDDAWYRCSLAAAQARSGRIDPARRTLEQLGAEGFPIRRIYPWAVAVTDVAEAAEVVGEPAAAVHVLRVAGPYSGRIAVSGPHPNRPFDQALAQAALAVGDTAAAESYASAAVAASRRRGTPAFLVRELVFLAETRRRRGAGEGAVAPLVREAMGLAERIGAGSAIADIERYALRT